MALSKKTCLQGVLVKAIVKNLINKEKCGSCKTKKCKRCDHKIKFVSEIERNIQQLNLEALVSIVLLLRR